MAAPSPGAHTSTAKPQKSFNQHVEEIFHMKAPLVYFIFVIVGIALFLIICCLCVHCRKRKRKKRRRHSGKPLGDDGMEADLTGSPRIKYGLVYTSATSSLAIEAVKAIDLPGKEKEVCPYVRIINEPTSYGPNMFPEVVTKVDRFNTNPSWKETFNFSMPIEALKGREVKFTVWNEVDGGIHTLIGTAYLELHEIPATSYFDKRHSEFIPIELASAGEPQYGEICLALRYERRTTAYELALTVVEARKLPLRKSNGGTMVVSLNFEIDSQPVVHKKTMKKAGSPNPYFNETFIFWTDLAVEMLNSSILVKVDYRRHVIGVTGKKCMGEIRLGKGIGDKAERLFWEQVLGNPRHQFARWYPLRAPGSTSNVRE